MTHSATFINDNTLWEKWKSATLQDLLTALSQKEINQQELAIILGMREFEAAKNTQHVSY